MAGTLEITPRLVHLEDMAATTTPTGDTETIDVLGGGAMSLTKIPITLLTQLVSAANDAAAGAGGVAVGEVYFLNTTSKLRTRMI